MTSPCRDVPDRREGRQPTVRRIAQRAWLDVAKSLPLGARIWDRPVMASRIRRGRGVAVALVAAVVLAGSGTALAARSVIKTQAGFVNVPAQRTRTLSVPYPDALEYGNARYSGRWMVLRPLPAAKGRKPSIGDVKALSAGEAEGGSLFRVRVRNDNPPGTAPLRLEVIATTVEPLPHS
jgi:hypothetical protein